MAYFVFVIGGSPSEQVLVVLAICSFEDEAATVAQAVREALGNKTPIFTTVGDPTAATLHAEGWAWSRENGKMLHPI